MLLMFFSSAGAATAAVGPLVEALAEALAEMTGAVKASMEA